MKRLPKKLSIFVAIGAAAVSVYGWQGRSPIVGEAHAAAQPAQPTVRGQSSGRVYLMHVHGLAYSPDGASIFVPSHEGLAIYSQGRWSKAPGPEHDYMGFSATHNAFYSSGHPAPGSNLVNPFGLLKSRDGGKTWQKLGLEGEADFHVMATSYGTDAVYVVNHRPNDRMREPGIYHTPSDGMQWTRSAANGLHSDIKTLAVHPTNAKVVAVGTGDGLYLSQDSGDHFKALASGQQVLSAWFDLDGVHLWYGSYAGKPALTRVNWKTGGDAAAMPLPPLTRDAVGYVAQNPVNHNEIAIATFKRSVFLSEDQGKTWKQIAKDGQTS